MHASSHSRRTLGPERARAFYDRVGRLQDTQSFYEEPALEEMIAHGRFGRARRIFELGCGTGRLARRLLERETGASTLYLGCDLSPVMVGLARRRLVPHRPRAGVLRADVTAPLPVGDGSVDRVISTYVLDLLSYADRASVLAEAHRILHPDGRLALVGLSDETEGAAGLVARLWKGLFRLHPSLVGGCRPLHLQEEIPPTRWAIEHRSVVAPYAIASEILVLRPRGAGD